MLEKHIVFLLRRIRYNLIPAQNLYNGTIIRVISQRSREEQLSIMLYVILLVETCQHIDILISVVPKNHKEKMILKHEMKGHIRYFFAEILGVYTKSYKKHKWQ